MFLVILAAPAEGLGHAGPGLLAAALTAILTDGIILRARRGRFEFPGGALISGLIVAMVLSAREPWPVVAFTSAVAIVSKYVFRSRAGNVFNPAALAIVATIPVFGAGQSWWGALPALPPLAQLALPIAGIFIADRVDRMPIVLAFLGSFYLAFTVAAFAGDPAVVAEVFRPPDLEAALFFAFFILTDPPTSPVKHRDQVACGLIVGGVSFGVFVSLGTASYLLAGVLIGNLWEAWRRVSRRLGCRFPSGVPAFAREVTPFRVQ